MTREQALKVLLLFQTVKQKPLLRRYVTKERRRRNKTPRRSAQNRKNQKKIAYLLSPQNYHNMWKFRDEDYFPR